MLNVGYIDYLNCFPFYYQMFENENIENIRITPGYPNQINRGIEDGTLDLSPISAAALSDVHNKVLVLPDFSLSSVGYVGSVILRSRVPIESLDGKTIGLTSASKTSMVLLKILLQDYYGLNPKYVPSTPNPTLGDLDAVLVIGNEAMVAPSEPVQFTYDLGELWLRKTGFPVVFAVFVVQKSSLIANEELVQSVIHSYERSIKALRTCPESVIAAASLKYPHIPYDLKPYYDQLDFNFLSSTKKALSFYLEKAGQLGLLNKDIKLEFMD